MSTLRNILDKEGITPTELSKSSGVNISTVHILCRDTLELFAKGKTPVNSKPATKAKIVHSINKVVGYDKYSVDTVFPVNGKK
ncbi:hypothetical protein WBJ53_05290 [Spirosoma sp. SC4-14]|uniref:hypothetical protein n=1 Tax=Spirosoma sp. SC4-14 TaxID=3128900 RepID=UPI0030CE7E9D